jgi:hypothetical protein
MASCGYSLLLQNADSCGISSEYPKHVVFVTLKDCERDISDHLKFCKISGDKAIDSEIKLLLARAGNIINVDIIIIIILGQN